MAFDFKKEEKQFYKPGKQPALVTIPKMTFITVTDKGDPNQEDSDFQKAIPLLYGIAYTIKIARKARIRSKTISTL